MAMPKTKRDRLQVSAFYSFYKFHRLGGMCREMSFAEAIAKSSDEKFDEIEDNPKRREALDLWLNSRTRLNNNVCSS